MSIESKNSAINLFHRMCANFGVEARWLGAKDGEMLLGWKIVVPPRVQLPFVLTLPDDESTQLLTHTIAIGAGAEVTGVNGCIKKKERRANDVGRRILIDVAPSASLSWSELCRARNETLPSDQTEIRLSPGSTLQLQEARIQCSKDTSNVNLFGAEAANVQRTSILINDAVDLSSDLETKLSTFPMEYATEIMWELKQLYSLESETKT